MKIRKAVIPVAGLGTRFLPATKAVPKELLPIVDKPSLQYIVEEIVSSGIREIILVTGRGKQGILDYFDHAPELEEILLKRGKQDLFEGIRHLSSLAKFTAVWQSEPLGLGHAILCAREAVGHEPFFVCLPDDLIDSSIPCVAQMIKIHEHYLKPLISVERVAPEEVSRYGILKAHKTQNHLYRIEDLVEKPYPSQAPSELAVVGRYLLYPEIFEILENIKQGACGEIQLTDALKLWTRHQTLYGFEFSGTRYDTGDKLGFLKANLAFGLKREEFGDKLRQYMQSLL